MANLNRSTSRWAGPAKKPAWLARPSGDYQHFLAAIRRAGGTDFCDECYAFVQWDHDECPDWSLLGLPVYSAPPVRLMLAGGLDEQVIDAEYVVLDAAPVYVERAPIALPERTLSSPSPWSAVVKRFEFAPVNRDGR